MSKLAEGVERLLVIGGDVFGATLIVQPGVLRSDGRIIEPRRNRVSRGNLSVYVLQNKGVSSLQHSRMSPVESRRVLAQRVAAASSFYADQFDFAVFDEFVESSDGVGTPANTGDYRGRELAFCLQDLSACLFADDPVEVAHHGGIGVRAQHTSQQVMC